MTDCNRQWAAAIIFCAAALLCWPKVAWAEAQRQFGVRLRGPLHEAIAAPLAGASEPGVVVDRAPAEPLEERPAAIKPSSPRAVWIAGYWGWEPATSDFIWIPGVWRIAPPGMRWVPGYWSDDCRWIRGFWYPVKEMRLSYRPSPPRPKHSPAPAAKADEFQAPGYWSYQGGEYRWKAGFAAQHKPGWVWIASHWAWSPRGALFVPGYWDYALASRGISFASVLPAADSPGSAGRRSVLSPSVAIRIAELPEAMFIAAGLGHYYFGDYFGGGQSDSLRPWYEPDVLGEVDANFAYECWQRRGEPNWQQTLTERYRQRRAREALRPAVEFNAAGESAPGKQSLGISVSGLSRLREARWSMLKISPEAVRQAADNSLSVKSLATRRARAEADSAHVPLVLDLPPPIAPLAQVHSSPQPRAATAGQYVPGVAGREVPGANSRSLPGTSGRTVPGVDVRIPGATAPGVLPGADTGVGRQ